MKIKSLIYTTLASALLFTSCDLNKQPVFNDDAQAFIAFDKTSGMMYEKDGDELGTIEISLYCASLAGINASTEITFNADAYSKVDESGAQVGNQGIETEHFNILYAVRYSIDFDNQSPTFNERINIDTIAFDAAPYVINFDNKHQFASIVIEGVDNDLRETNKKFDVKLTNIQGCHKGAMNTFTVTILDDENPFNRLMGEYSAVGESGFDGSELSWDLTITADDSVANMIWIHPVLQPFAGLGAGDIHPVKATVDEVQGTITMPLGQTLFGGEGQTYNIQLAIYDASVGQAKTGGNSLAVFTVEDGVEIRWNDMLCAYQEGFYQAIIAPVFTKK